MGMLEGKVALITGGSRGQGRAHAVTCAREGADVIIVDIADQMDTVPYTMATQADLDETVAQVEAYDRRALALKADVRIQLELDQAVARGIAEFGKIDILIANAASGPRPRSGSSPRTSGTRCSASTSPASGSRPRPSPRT